jgi:ribonuclease HI
MPKIVEDALVVYTDGSLYPKGRKGGYGIVFLDVDANGQETPIEDYAPPGVRGATGNRMELQAVIDALERIPYLDCYPRTKRVVVRTDSRYVVDKFPLATLDARNRWRTQAGKPIDNTDLWKDLLRAQRKLGLRVDVQWVKGHAKDQHNIRADNLAKESANNPLARREFRSSVRRKISPTRTKAGSVGVAGQTITIYVVEAQWLNHHRTWKYRYQVMSKDSTDYGNTDWIYGTDFIKSGHCYRVRLNDDAKFPQILEVEIEVPREAAP